MTVGAFSNGWVLEPVRQTYPRRLFDCGERPVNDWLRTKAFQHQSKRLSATKVLVDAEGSIAGFYTLATGQIDFGDLPPAIVRQLPRRGLPVAVLAWLGVTPGTRAEALAACFSRMPCATAMTRDRHSRSWRSSSTA